jgi:hypothetical protein
LFPLFSDGSNYFNIMSTLTISQYTCNPSQELSTDDTLEVRAFYTRSFIASDAVTPVFGNNSNGAFGPYYSITPTLNGSGDLVVPAHVVQPTTESNPTGSYIEQLWVNGAFSQTLMPNTGAGSGWQIPTVYGDPIAYDEIATYNRAKRLLYPPATYFTADQTIEEIRRIAGDFDYAGFEINGITSLSVAPVVASEPIAVGVNDPNYLPSAAPGKVYNVFAYGIVGAAHGGSPADESTALLALLTTVYNAGGGVIQFNDRAYRFDSSVLFPNTGASPPSQPSTRLTGMGPSHNGQGGAPSGGTIIDLRYNSTLSKIDTRGLGFLEIDHITFKDGGASSSVPFLQTTNTTLHVHDCEFYGNTATTPTQDAIVLGNTSTGTTGNFNSSFQGYGTVVENNYFNRIQRGVYGRTFCNAVGIVNNTWWTQCGGTAAVEFLADVSNSDTGNYIRGNLIEVGNYTYGMKFGGPFINNNVGPNGFFDETVTTQAIYRFEAGGIYNMVVDGYRNDTVDLISETGASIGTNTIFTSHQSEVSTFAQPVTFRNTVKAITANGADNWGMETSAGNLFSLPFTNDDIAVAYTPNGSARESYVTFERASSTDKRLRLEGTSNNVIYASSADLRLQAPSGQTLWLGTVAAPSALLITAAAITPSVPIVNASLTAPTATTIAIGSGTVISKVLKGTVTIDPTSINATTFSSQTFTLTGAVAGDTLILNPPAAGLTAGLFVLQHFVSGADTITICFYNSTGAPIDQASGSWNYTLIR